MQATQAAASQRLIIVQTETPPGFSTSFCGLAHGKILDLLEFGISFGVLWDRFQLGWLGVRGGLRWGTSANEKYIVITANNSSIWVSTHQRLVNWNHLRVSSFQAIVCTESFPISTNGVSRLLVWCWWSIAESCWPSLHGDEYFSRTIPRSIK